MGRCRRTLPPLFLKLARVRCVTLGIKFEFWSCQWRAAYRLARSNKNWLK